MNQQTFRQPIVNGETRFIEGSTGRLLGTETQLKEIANMARLEGTGKDPLGRYGKGEIFDVPRSITAGEGDEAVTVENDTYQELIDKGWAKEVDPKDDPGRTTTQVADAKVVDPNASLAHPVDASLAADISQADAYAIVHTGDPKASGDGDLKTDSIREAQGDPDTGVAPSPRFLGDDRVQEEAAPAEEAPAKSQRASAASGSSASSGS